MTDQTQFDHLRQTCSARLELFIAASRKTELSVKQLSMPVSQETARQIFAQRSTEAEASENYNLACLMLRDFLSRHSYSVH